MKMKQYRINMVLYSILFMLYNLLAYNYVFFAEIYKFSNSVLWEIGTFLTVWALGSVACLLLFWRCSVKPLSYLFLLINSGVFYFVRTYHAYINSEMLQNVLQTNRAEVMELMNFHWLLYVLILGVVPALVISRLKIETVHWRKRLSIIGTLLCMVLAILVPNRREVIPFARVHKPTTYLSCIASYL